MPDEEALAPNANVKIEARFVIEVQRQKITNLTNDLVKIEAYVAQQHELIERLSVELDRLTNDTDSSVLAS